MLHQSILVFMELPRRIPREDHICLPDSLGPVLRRFQPHEPGSVRKPLLEDVSHALVCLEADQNCWFLHLLASL